MKYTLKQLKQIYQNQRSLWIAFRNDDTEYPDADVSGRLKEFPTKSTGAWVVQVSIRPCDMEKALPVLHQFVCDKNAPRMMVKIASQRILKRDHESAKQIMFVFDKDEEKNNQESILSFLWKLGCALEKAEIKEDAKPPLTLHTKGIVKACGSEADKLNLQKTKKYVAPIKMKETEKVSRFYYRANVDAPIISNSFYGAWQSFYNEGKDQLQEDVRDEDRNTVVKASDFEAWGIDNHPEFKHNPLQQPNDFFNGVILEEKFYQEPIAEETPQDVEIQQTKMQTEVQGENPPLKNDFEEAKKNLLAEIKKLQKHGEKIGRKSTKGGAVIDLAIELKDCANAFFNLKGELQVAQSDKFVGDFKAKLTSKNDLMHDPRLSLKTTLINIGIACTGVGAFFLAYQLYASHKAGRTVGFFAKKQTTRDEHIQTIQTSVEKIAPIPM